MKLVIGLIVGVVIGALVGYVLWGSKVSDLQARFTQLETKLAAITQPAGTPGTVRGTNPHSAIIALEGAEKTQCKGKVDPLRIGNKRNMRILWALDWEDAPCTGNGNWKVELRFDNAADGTTWDYGAIEIKKNGVTKWNIPSDAKIGLFPYHVWMIPQSGAPYEVVDPELQIEM